jgi:O-antigen/teichoic acid export membrane protein
MSKVKRNIIANYVGSAWSALMSVAFVPVYIRYIGIEAYGLIGLFTLIQSWLVLLDVGLTPTLSREMARFEAGVHTVQSISNLLKSIERVYLVVAAVLATTIITVSPWIAKNWIRADKLDTATIRHALAITGFVVALRWLTGLYRGALIGLQHQVWLSFCGALFSTLRGLGAIGVLIWISPTITAFFVYQGVLAAVEAIVLAVHIRRVLPTPPAVAQFSWMELRKVSNFAAGMATITLLSILLMQVDKLVLSRMLTLKDFGYYALASAVAGSLSLIIGPINNAIYPRLTEFVARREDDSLSRAYHRFAQMLTLTLVPAAVVLSLFSTDAMLLWTRDPITTARIAPLISVLVIGVTLNGLMHTPYMLQLAHGWTRFMIVVNAGAALLVVPAIYFGVHMYGAVAAAYIWTILNASYIVFAVPAMHRVLLPLEIRKWYIQDSIIPSASALGAALIIRLIAPAAQIDKPMVSVAILASAGVAALSAASLVSPLARDLFDRYVRIRRDCL